MKIKIKNKEGLQKAIEQATLDFHVMETYVYTDGYTEDDIVAIRDEVKEYTQDRKFSGKYSEYIRNTYGHFNDDELKMLYKSLDKGNIGKMMWKLKKLEKSQWTAEYIEV